MPNAYINVYKNLSQDGSGGTDVSLGGTYADPISVALNATLDESKKVKLAIRCQPNYTTSGDVTISTSGDDANNPRWGLCTTENGTYTNSITIPGSTPIGTTNVPFWVQARAFNTETPGTDRSVSLQVSATIVTA